MTVIIALLTNRLPVCNNDYGMITQQQITPGICTKCANPTGADWKTLCRACWKKQSPDEIRAYRQAKIDRKVARLNKWADSRDSKAESKMAEFNENRKDWAYVTQPNINTSGGRAFTRRREKVLDRYDAGIRLSIEADDLREKANWLQRTGAVVKGDAERRRQAERDALDKVITVGTRVADRINASGFNLATVIKVNKKTYTLKFDHGSQYPVEKTFVRLLEGGEK